MKDYESREEIKTLNLRINKIVEILETGDSHFPPESVEIDRKVLFNHKLYREPFLIGRFKPPYPLNGKVIVSMIKEMREQIELIKNHLGVEIIYHTKKTTLEKIKK